MSKSSNIIADGASQKDFQNEENSLKVSSKTYKNLFKINWIFLFPFSHSVKLFSPQLGWESVLAGDNSETEKRERDGKRY
jgi:hypothetical protein